MTQTIVMNKKYVASNLMIIALFLFVGFTACKKEKEEMTLNETNLCLTEIDGSFETVELDIAPKYLNGGLQGFHYDILDKITYPAEARMNDIQGTCLVQYEITKEGTVENIEAVQDPGGGIGTHTVSVLTTVTEGISYAPGILSGQPVHVKKEFELKFRLE